MLQNLCQLKYLIAILKEIYQKHQKFTQAQDTPPSSH